MTAPRFVGRGSELDILTSALADARRGDGRVVLLEGEPGIGKTRLAMELVARAMAENVRVGVGRAWEGAGAPPWFVWTEALRPLLGEGEELVLPSSVVSDEGRFVGLDRIATRVRALASTEPLVLVLDDLQWSGAASLLALRLVARTMRGAKLLAIGTVRSSHDAGVEVERLLVDIRREAQVVPVGGLDDGALGDLARARGVDAPSAGAALRRATAGNPLYAVELLLEDEARAALAAGTSPPLTRSVGALLDRHLERLDADLRVIACAAIGPQPTRPSELAVVIGGSSHDATRALERARKLDIMKGAGEELFVFTHDLLRRAAQARVAAHELRAIHAGWAAALRHGGDTRAVDRARHLLAADPDTSDGDVADAVARAAHACRARYAYADAAALLEQLVAMHERGGRVRAAAESLAMLGHARYDCGDLGRAAECAERAIAIARELGDARVFAEGALALGRRRTMAMADRSLAAVLDEALALLARETGPSVLHLRCRLEARLACALQPDGDSDRALSLARGAITRARESGDRDLLARVLHGARPAFRIVEDLDERLTIDRELVEHAERLSDDVLLADAHARLLRTAAEAGDRTLFDLHMTAYERLAGNVGLADHELGLASARVMARTIQGELAEATRIVEELEGTRASWQPRLTAKMPMDPIMLLRIAIASAAGVPTPFERMLGVASSMPLPVPVFRQTFLAFFAARAGKLDVARPHFDAATSSVEPQLERSYILQMMLADVCVRLRDEQHAVALYAWIRPYAGRHVMWLPFWFYDGAVDRLLGGLAALAGRAEAARAHYEHAVASEEAFGARPFAARTRRERDALLGAPPVATRPVKVAPRAGGPTLVQDGETWLISLGDAHARIADADGLRYLAILLDRPNIPVAAFELFASRAKAADPIAAPADGGDVLDRAAIMSYRRRAKDLEATIADAQTRSDPGALEAARQELAFLEVELARAVGLGGRSRKLASDGERIRVNVTQRIRKVIEKIRVHAPTIADHLARTVRTGSTCVYSPPLGG